MQIKDETDLTETVVCNEHAYDVPLDVANELKRLRELEAAGNEFFEKVTELGETIRDLFSK